MLRDDQGRGRAGCGGVEKDSMFAAGGSHHHCIGSAEPELRALERAGEWMAMDTSLKW